MNIESPLSFRCNICGGACSANLADLTREASTCRRCGSSVRTRSVIHLLTLALFGVSRKLPDLPENRELSGLGLSDWEGYAKLLKSKFGYVNTFYHKEPFLDITKLDKNSAGGYDFIISSEVFEHVAPPVSRAFANCFSMLKPGGLLVLTVPYQVRGPTIEHFPDLHQYEIIERGGIRILRNLTAEGKEEWFEKLCFHGGAGNTLEMRVFSELGLKEELSRAGFENIRIHDEAMHNYGIHWLYPWSLPLSARKPLA